MIEEAGENGHCAVGGQASEAGGERPRLVVTMLATSWFSGDKPNGYYRE